MGLSIWQILIIAVVILVLFGRGRISEMMGDFGKGISSFKKGKVGRFTRIMRGFCLWVRDEMVYSVMGKEEGRKFVPLFLFMFFFIVFMNVIGLVPSISHSFPGAIYTATGTPYVTGALAIITLGLMLGLGIKKNGALGFFVRASLLSVTASSAPEGRAAPDHATTGDRRSRAADGGP